MRENLTRKKLERDEIAAGYMMLSADPHVVGCMAACGYDTLRAFQQAEVVVCSETRA